MMLEFSPVTKACYAIPHSHASSHEAHLPQPSLGRAMGRVTTAAWASMGQGNTAAGPGPQCFSTAWWTSSSRPVHVDEGRKGW